MKLRFLIFITVFFSIGIFVNAQNVSEMPRITVTGTAEIRVVPDEAIFNLKVEKLNKDLKIAQKENDETVSQILSITKQFAIPAQDVKTDVYEYEEKYTWVGEDEDKRVFLGYQVSKDVVIRLSNMSKFEDLFREIIKSGVSKVDSVDLRTTEIRKYKDQARASAMKAAKEKATAMAAEIGQTIGKATMILEGTISNNSRNSNITSNNYIGSNYSPSYSSEENSTFSVGTISVKASVTVSFLLN